MIKFTLLRSTPVLRLCRFLLTACLSVFFIETTQSQNRPVIDSLERELAKAPEDSNKTRLYYRLWQQVRNNDLVEAEKYARIGLAHARKIKWGKGEVAFCTSMGELHEHLNNEDSVVYYYQKGIEVAEKVGYTKGLSGLYINLSAFHANRADYVSAIEIGMKALHIAESINDTSYVLFNYNNIGNFYFSQENYPKAREYYESALKWLPSPATDSEESANLYHSLGLLSATEGDTTQAIVYFESAGNIHEYNDNLFQLAQVYSNLAALIRDYPTKFDYAYKSQELFDQVGMSRHVTSITNLSNLGASYLELLKNKNTWSFPPNSRIPGSESAILSLAEKQLNRAVNLSRETGNSETLYYALRLMGELEEYRNRPAQALSYLKESYQISDSLFSQENKNRIAALESQRALDERDKQIALNQLHIESSNRIRIALIVGALLLFIIGALLFYQNRIRQQNIDELKKLNQELDNANRLKARFFGILSHDLRKPVSNLLHFLYLQKEAPELLTDVPGQQNKLQSSAQNLLDTMETVLLWSKSQMERFEPQLKSVPVSAVMDHLKKTLPEEAPVSYPADLGVNSSLFTDEDYLKTIVNNLTANALSATARTPDPKVSWELLEMEGERILRISDNGPGMSPEKLATLFDPDAAVSTKNGLGLHIIRDMAKAIGCQIVAHSQQGKGTVIDLRFSPR